MPKHRKSTAIQTTELCCYGCGQVAQYQSIAGKLQCSPRSTQCIVNKRKNSAGLADAYASGTRITQKEVYSNLSDATKDRMSWNRGLTKDTDERVAQHAKAAVGKRRKLDSTRDRLREYRSKCEFDIVGIVQKIPGYDLLVKYGMYDRVKNPTGVVRDHIVSVKFGFDSGVDPSIIRHPANCQFLLHKDNARKTYLSSISLDELHARIRTWDSEGNLVYLVE